MSTPTTHNTAKDSAELHARQAANSEWLDRAARLGFLAKGLVYALIGVLAFQVAMGDQQRADQKGALQAIAAKPGGSVVLWLMVLGFLAYAVWRFSEAAFGPAGRDRREEAHREAPGLRDQRRHLPVLRRARVPHRDRLVLREQRRGRHRQGAGAGRAARLSS